MNLTAEIIAFIILLTPIVWEYQDDRNGDFNKKKDVLIRVVIAVTVCAINYLLVQRSIIQSGLMCFALFFFIFDYWIASVFAPKGQWFSYGGKSGWFDNIPAWKKNPWVRLGIRLAVLIGSLIYYF